MLASSDLQSLARHVLSILVLLGAIKLNNEQLEGMVPTVAVFLSVGISFVWSRWNRKSLLYTDPSTGDKIAPALLLALCLGGVVLGGCAQNKGTVGPSFVPTADGAEVRNGSPVNMQARTPVGAGKDAENAQDILTANATGPSGYAIATDEQARWWAVNQVQRNIFFRRMPDGTLSFNSNTGTDVEIAAAQISIDPKTGVITGKDLKLKTSASDPFKASNESMTALKEVFLKLPEEQQKVWIAQLQAQADVAKNVVPSVAAEITKMVEFLTAK